MHLLYYTWYFDLPNARRALLQLLSPVVQRKRQRPRLTPADGLHQEPFRTHPLVICYLCQVGKCVTDCLQEISPSNNDFPNLKIMAATRVTPLCVMLWKLQRPASILKSSSGSNWKKKVSISCFVFLTADLEDAKFSLYHKHNTGALAIQVIH